MLISPSTLKEPEEAIGAAQLVGRNKIVQALLEQLRKGRSAILVGAAGVGKTAILRAVAERASKARDPHRPIYCGQGSTLKAILTSLARQLLILEAPQITRSEGTLGRLSVGKLKRFVLPRLRSGRYALLLDHFGLVRGAYATFLEELTDRARVPVVFAVRSLDPRESGRPWWIAVGLETVEVPPLSPGEARRFPLKGPVPVIPGRRGKTEA